MLILALDTTTRGGSVAVTRDDTVIAVVEGDRSRTHGARLPAEIEQALARAQVRASELLEAILRNLDLVPEGQQVMLKLSLPVEPGLFDPLVRHPRVLRVVALSGGFSRAEACRELAKNPGMIASFSRALLSDLRHDQSDEEFDHVLGTAIDEIHCASVAEVPA